MTVRASDKSIETRVCALVNSSYWSALGRAPEAGNHVAAWTPRIKALTDEGLDERAIQRAMVDQLRGSPEGRAAKPSIEAVVASAYWSELGRAPEQGPDHAAYWTPRLSGLTPEAAAEKIRAALRDSSKGRTFSADAFTPARSVTGLSAHQSAEDAAMAAEFTQVATALFGSAGGFTLLGTGEVSRVWGNGDKVIKVVRPNHRFTNFGGMSDPRRAALADEELSIAAAVRSVPRLVARFGKIVPESFSPRPGVIVQDQVKGFLPRELGNAEAHARSCFREAISIVQDALPLQRFDVDNPSNLRYRADGEPKGWFDIGHPMRFVPWNERVGDGTLEQTLQALPLVAADRARFYLQSL